MPMLMQDSGPVAPRMAVRGSFAVELDWALSAALRLGRAEMRPELEELYRSDPHLADDVRGIWVGDDRLSYPGFIELSVLAHSGGLLFGLDGDHLLESLDGLCARAPRDLALASESEEDRARVQHRLEILRGSPRRRRDYIEVVRRAWSAVRPVWEAEGLDAVKKDLGARQAVLDRGPSWREFAARECKSDSLLDHLVEVLDPAGELVVVPAFFAHSGLLLELPGVVIVGVRLAGAAAAAKARTEQLARRFKALADPTRMAILTGLTHGEMTVTDIARRFDLAQPTVSNHVKLLRDAGFVTVRSEGRSRLLAVDRETLDGLGREVRDLFGGPPEG